MATYKHQDYLHQRAKMEGFRSRAAYKLLEIQKKFSIFKPGFSVLDIGAAPGGWLQVAASQVAPNGTVIGVDLEPIVRFKAEELAPNALKPEIVQGDITDGQVQAKVLGLVGGGVDVLLSDVSPKLSGIRFRDAAISAELVQTVFDIAGTTLKPGGSIVAKIFPSTEANEVFNLHQRRFGKLSRVVLDASRKTSKEFYFVGRVFKG